jgi:FemAB-related protein (PEP-CTERM system-associated)
VGAAADRAAAAVTAVLSNAAIHVERRPMTGGSGNVRVRELEPSSTGRWDAFVAECPSATFFHRAGWKRVIEEAFGHRTFFLYAEDAAGAIVGVLPLVLIRSLLFGRSLTSTAFCVYGGPATASASAEEALTARAIEIAREHGVLHVEYRSRAATRSGWQTKSSLYATFRKALDPDVEKNLAAIPRKQRAMVRKGISANLISEIDATVDRMHAVYAESVRNLGTPVFPKKYFALLQREFPDACEVLTVVHGGIPVSSVMSFFFRDEVLPYYGGGTFGARAVAANDFMYWEVMRRAVERGYRLFDFGRSKYGTGAFQFKTHWGFEPEPLQYEYYLVRGDRLPDVTPLNPKFQRLIAAWKRLPLPIATFVGPWIARDLG